MNDEKFKKAESAIVNLTIYNSFENINNNVNVMDKQDLWLGGVRDAILAIRELDMVSEVMKADEWIPVSERLPEDGERVLAITESGNQFVGFHTQFSGWHFEHVIHPTHWMPLPEPPMMD